LSKSPYSTSNIYNCIFNIFFLFDVLDLTRNNVTGEILSFYVNYYTKTQAKNNYCLLIWLKKEEKDARGRIISIVSWLVTL